MQDTDALLAMYSEQISQARQHENMRERATNLTFIIGSAISAVLFRDNGSSGFNAHALAWLLIAIGVFSLVLSMKNYERNRFHVTVARGYRTGLEKRLADCPIQEIRLEGEKTHNNEYRVFRRLRLNWLWSLLPITFVAIGIIRLV